MTRFGYLMIIGGAVLLVLWLLCLGLQGCTPRYPDPTQACAAACDRLAELECEAAQPTPEGATCLMICLDTERTHWTTMHPACVAVAESCEEASRVSADGCSP